MDANWLITGQEIIKEIDLSNDEKELLTSFRTLSDKEKWKIIGQVEHIAKENVSGKIK